MDLRRAAKRETFYQKRGAVAEMSARKTASEPFARFA